MVKSMLDLRLLDSYSPDAKEEQQEAPEEQEEVQLPLTNPDVLQPLALNLMFVLHAQNKTRPLQVGTAPHLRGRGPDAEAGLYRTNRELGSTISLQVTSAWVRGHMPTERQVMNEPARSHWLTVPSLQVADEEARTNHRPDYIQLSNQSPDVEEMVLYPNQWEDGASLAER